MISLIIALILLIVFSLLPSVAALSPFWLGIVASGFWLTLALSIHLLLIQFVWRGILPKITGHKIPRVLIQLTGAILALIALGIIAIRVLEVPVVSVLTTSSVFIAIIGFALRNMISDLFTGIALGVEQPFTPGDWIEIQDGTVGMVVEMNWRSTRLLTLEEVSIVVPNSELAISTFKNYSKPERAWRDEFSILLDKEVTAHQAERLLLSAARQIPEIVRLNKPVDVRIKEYTAHGNVWLVRYWVPDYPQMSLLRYQVQKSVLKNMHHAGLSIPAEQTQVSRRAAKTHDEGFQFLRGIGLFSALNDDEVALLRQSMADCLLERGKAIVKQGEPGESLFIVKEGLLQVNITMDNQRTLTVAHLIPGSFFGEMSLLTGSPRNATVTAQVDTLLYEINKSDLEPILQARPEIAETLSKVLLERQLLNESQTESQLTPNAQSDDSLLHRIHSFFSLHVDPRLS